MPFINLPKKRWKNKKFKKITKKNNNKNLLVVSSSVTFPIIGNGLGPFTSFKPLEYLQAFIHHTVEINKNRKNTEKTISNTNITTILINSTNSSQLRQKTSSFLTRASIYQAFWFIGLRDKWWSNYGLWMSDWFECVVYSWKMNK